MDNGYPRGRAVALDAADPLAGFREEFLADSEPGLIYLDGNSLGRMPAATPGFLDQVVRDGWGRGLVRSWETWIDWGRNLGDRIGTHLLGAKPGEVVLSDGTSVNLYKLAAAALDAAPHRGTILIDAEDFPTNRYVMQGLARQRGLRVRALRSDLDEGLDSGLLRSALDADVALMVLSLVSYRSGALLDMAEVNAAASDAGAVVLWDLSHAVGAVPVDLAASGASLAVGCTYKYLNGGPGSPAFLYVREELRPALRQPIWGWYGQRDQFGMGPTYDPVEEIDRFLVGTPPLLSLAAVAPALDVIERAGVGRLRDKAILLGQMVVELADRWLSPHGFRLASPRDPLRRGSHVSLAHPQAWRMCRALAADANVICDYRVPDRLRIAPAPLYTSFADTWDALDRLRDIAASRSYERQAATLARVT